MPSASALLPSAFAWSNAFTAAASPLLTASTSVASAHGSRAQDEEKREDNSPDAPGAIIDDQLPTLGVAELGVGSSSVVFIRLTTTPSRPVLSPSFSAGTPALSSRLSSRFVIGVSVRKTRCRPPRNVPRRRRRQRSADRSAHGVRVAEARAVQEHRVIEQRAVALGRRLQLLEEPREQLAPDTC